MDAAEILKELGEKQGRVAKWLMTLLWVLLGVGVLVFLTGLSGPNPSRIWTAFLTNYIYWTGIAQAAVVFSAVRQVTGAQWGKPVHRIAQSFVAFLPVSYILLFVLGFGRNELFEWVRHPIPEKSAWLNVPFFFAREGVILAILFGFSLYFVVLSLQPDLKIAVAHVEGWRKKLYSRLIRNSLSEAKNEKRLALLSPILIILYALFFTVFAWDWIMSLEPHWVSTLFGAFYFVGSLFHAFVVVTLFTVILYLLLRLDRWIDKTVFHDLGKLVHAFCILWVYFFWSQYLVIWYGNLPEEAFWFAERELGPYRPVSYTVLFMVFVIPFIVFLFKRLKENPKLLGPFVCIPLVGMWFERFVLVAPSVLGTRRVWLGAPELLMSLGFAALFVLCFLAFFRTFPILPVKALSQSSADEHP